MVEEEISGVEFIETMLAGKPGVFCLPEDIEVVIPRACFESCPEATALIERTMTKIFGGVTRTDGVGSWMDDQGKPVVEPVAIIKSAHQCVTSQEMEEFVKTVGQAGILAEQDAIFIRKGKAWIVPPGHLVKGLLE